MEVQNDIQQQIFDAIKLKLEPGEKLSSMMMDQLHLSQDAAYRRLRGDVPLTIYETKTLCELYGLSFDDYGKLQKGRVQFTYNPLDRIGLNFETYLTGLRDGLREAKNLPDVRLIMSINDTPIFQLFNLPHLTRFKFFFWAKTYLKIPAYADQKFKREKIDKSVLAVGIEAHNLYNSIPTYEIYSPEALRGTLRQIEYYFDAHLFEDPSYALELIDNLIDLLHHMKAQAESGKKFARGNEPTSGDQNFFMYSNETYIADNTYVVKWDSGSAVYLSHNIMNYLNTMDPYYVTESERILEELQNNSSLISAANAKERNKFFGNIERTVLNFRRKVESELEF